MGKHLVLVAFAATASLIGSLANGQATISIDPTSQTTSTGTVVTIDVDIANVTNLYAYQFDLTFNPSVLTAVSSSEGSFLTTGGNSTFFIPGTNNNVDGVVSATADTILSAVPGVNGSGELAVFTFDAIGKGLSTLGFENVMLLDSSFNSISNTTTGATVTVGSGTAKVPEIDPASAISALTLLGGVIVLCGRRTMRDYPPLPRAEHVNMFETHLFMSLTSDWA
jgi:hypothetical protein